MVRRAGAQPALCTARHDELLRALGLGPEFGADLAPLKKENSFLTYGGNGVRHMGKRGCVGESKKKEHLRLVLQRGANFRLARRLFDLKSQIKMRDMGRVG